MATDAPPMPESDKVVAVSERSQTIGDFIDWLSDEKDLVLCQHFEGDKEGGREGYFPASPNMTKLLAEYFEIDLDVVEDERRRLIEFIRKEREDGQSGGHE